MNLQPWRQGRRSPRFNWRQWMSSFRGSCLPKSAQVHAKSAQVRESPFEGSAKVTKRLFGRPQVSKIKPHRSFNASAQHSTHTFWVPDVFKKTWTCAAATAAAAGDRLLQTKQAPASILIANLCRIPSGPEGFSFHFDCKFCRIPSGPESFSFHFDCKLVPYPLWP